MNKPLGVEDVDLLTPHVCWIDSSTLGVFEDGGIAREGVPSSHPRGRHRQPPKLSVDSLLSQKSVSSKVVGELGHICQALTVHDETIDPDVSRDGYWGPSGMAGR